MATGHRSLRIGGSSTGGNEHEHGPTDRQSGQTLPTKIPNLGRLLVLRGRTNALSEEYVGLRADLYNLMQAMEANL